MMKQDTSRCLSPVHLTGCKPDQMKSKSNMVIAISFLYRHLIGDAMEDIISYAWVNEHAYTCTYAYINMFYMHSIPWTAHHDGYLLKEERFCLILFMAGLLNGYGG